MRKTIQVSCEFHPKDFDDAELISELSSRGYFVEVKDQEQESKWIDRLIECWDYHPEKFDPLFEEYLAYKIASIHART